MAVRAARPDASVAEIDAQRLILLGAYRVAHHCELPYLDEFQLAAVTRSKSTVAELNKIYLNFMTSETGDMSAEKIGGDGVVEVSLAASAAALRITVAALGGRELPARLSQYRLLVMVLTLGYLRAHPSEEKTMALSEFCQTLATDLAGLATA